MEFDSRIPIYIQIIEKIKQDIILKKINMGEKLPSVRIMAADLKVNVNTVQRVYQELEREGVIYSVRGKGSFITESEGMVAVLKAEMAKELLRRFVYGMGEIGFDNQQIVQYLKQYMEESNDGTSVKE